LSGELEALFQPVRLGIKIGTIDARAFAIWLGVLPNRG
jgi:hypothetical protein